ncbi:MAG: molybdenum cofactor guanylyltransferase [Lacipirellulaceae bacterium]
MIPVYVLAGGGSKRFGREKASVLIDGVPWGIDVGRRLAGEAEFTIVGPAPPGGELAGLRFIADATPARGPLSGAVAALRDRLATGGPGLLVLASCDLVHPEAAWLDPLAAAYTAEPLLEAVAYRAADRWQPYPSVVHTRWLATLERSLAAGVTSYQRALDDAFAGAIDWPYPTAGPPQANTPDELAALLPGVRIG